MSLDNQDIYFCSAGHWWKTSRLRWAVLIHFQIINKKFYDYSDHALYVGGKPLAANNKNTVYIGQMNKRKWKALFAEYPVIVRDHLRKRYPKRHSKKLQAFLIKRIR